MALLCALCGSVLILACFPRIAPALGSIAVCIVEAANPCVILRVRDIGLNRTELPDWLDANAAVLPGMRPSGPPPGSPWA